MKYDYIGHHICQLYLCQLLSFNIYVDIYTNEYMCVNLYIYIYIYIYILNSSDDNDKLLNIILSF